MPDDNLPPGWGPAPFDERDLDAVLDGKTADIPVVLRPVVDVCAALSAGPSPAELYGEANAMAEFRALGLGQAGLAPTMLLEALPDGQRAGRPGRPPARHRVRPDRRHPVRRAALRPAMLSAFAAAAVIVLAVLVTGNFAPLRDIAHMARPSAGTGSSASTGHPAAPRVETSSAGLETTPPPSEAYSTAPAQPTSSEICRAYYADIKHPGPSAWVMERSLWEQLTKLAGSDNWLNVYQYCRPYVKDFVPDAQGPGQNQAGNQNNGYLGQQSGVPAGSSGSGQAGNGQASNGQASNGQGDAAGSGSNP